MKFEYKGVQTNNDERVAGIIIAGSKQEAYRLLDKQEIKVFSLQIQRSDETRGRRVKVDDLVLPLQELATLTSSGVSLIDAIYALADNDEHPQLSRGFRLIAANIEAGGSFSESLDESQLPFPKYVAQLVKAGELGGQLTLALNNASSQMQYDQSIKSDLKSALTYPLVLIGSGIAAMLLIFFAVVPKFSHMLDGDKELPWLAYAVLSAGAKVNESPLLVLFSIVSVIAMIVLVFSQQKVRIALLDRALYVPVLGPWLAEQDTAKWASLTAAMLQAKVSLISALSLSASASNFTKRRARAMQMVQEIEQGSAFSEALQKANLVPSTSMNLVTVGDKTGQLADMLTAVANLHDTSCKRRMKQVLTLMEPIAILIVGVLIGVMILGIVLAITASTDIAI